MNLKIFILKQDKENYDYKKIRDINFIEKQYKILKKLTF